MLKSYALCKVDGYVESFSGTHDFDSGTYEIAPETRKRDSALAFEGIVVLYCR
jgi:hypothetical protein